MVRCCSCLPGGITGPLAMLADRSEHFLLATGNIQQVSTKIQRMVQVQQPWYGQHCNHTALYSTSENNAIKEREVICKFWKIYSEWCSLQGNRKCWAYCWAPRESYTAGLVFVRLKPLAQQKQVALPTQLIGNSSWWAAPETGLTITQRQPSRAELELLPGPASATTQACYSFFIWDIRQATCSDKENGQFPWSIKVY